MSLLAKLSRWRSGKNSSRSPSELSNKTAGAGLEAIAYLADKRGDDHTIAIFTNTWIATPLTNKEAKYTVTDLTAIVRLVLEPTIVVVRADSPYKNMNDFVAAAKQNPLGLKQAGGSVTAIESLSGLLIQKLPESNGRSSRRLAIKDRIANLLAGNVDVIIPQPQDVNEHISAGRMRPIAALTRSALPSCRTWQRSRNRGSTFPSSPTPAVSSDRRRCRENVEYWEDFFSRLVQTTSWKKYVEENQVRDVFLKSREVAPFLEEQNQLMRSVLQAAGVKVAR